MSDLALNPTVVPAMFEHAQRVYDTMHQASRKESVGERSILVYEGHLTGLFKKLLLPQPYYTKIKNMLVAMGCIEQLRRGGGNGTSKWVVWHAPELEAWKTTEAKRPSRGNAQTMHGQMIKDLASRVDKLEQVVEALLTIVNNKIA